jgi:hypothetical protein
MMNKYCSVVGLPKKNLKPGPVRVSLEGKSEKRLEIKS